MNDGVMVSQLGARMYYAVPRIFERWGHLETLNTDICAARGWPRTLNALPRSVLPASLRRLAGRVPAGIPAHKIRCFESIGLRAAMRRMMTPSAAVDTEVALRSGEAFSRAVVAAGFGDVGGVYGMSGECLEQLAAARRAGLWTAVEQVIAPRSEADRLVALEHERHPGWEPPPRENRLAADYARREEAEWAQADVVICPSEFVRDGIARAGGPVDKCVVVPYGVDAPALAAGNRPALPGRLRVLTVGSVGLRKGTPYVLAVAARMGRMASFRMVGPAAHLPEARRSELSDVLELVGQVPRGELAAHYRWADVFLLPSVCEGSATVIYEALAAGLPVVTTHNAGSIVRDGVDGFICPVGDVDAICERLERLASGPELRRWMGGNARERASDFDVEAYGHRLMAALAPLMGRKRHPLPGS